MENLLCHVDSEGLEGWAEAAPGRAGGPNALDACLSKLKEWNENEAAAVDELSQAEHVPGGTDSPSARCAFALAFLDAVGRSKRRSLRSLLNLPDGERPTSITLSLGPTKQVLEEAAIRDQEGWPVFKVKLGGEEDVEVVTALRDRYPEKWIRVDANGGWSPQQAALIIPKLERLVVEFVEQPLPASMLDECADLARKVDVPIILDESLRDMDDALRLVQMEAGDGGNIKFAKCGGPWEARRIVKFLRDSDWKVMVGCMIESSLGTSAAAAFAGTCDFVDLDAHELIRDDPFTGFSTPNGLVVTPSLPGIGVQPRSLPA